MRIQKTALTAAGCFKIFEEKKSGTRRHGRTELEVLLECVREGDTVVVTGGALAEFETITCAGSVSLRDTQVILSLGSAPQLGH